jgi:hypothetical protein
MAAQELESHQGGKIGNRAVFAQRTLPYATRSLCHAGDAAMHRYLVERTFAPGSQAFAAALSEPSQPLFIQAHDVCGVTWLRSYLTPDEGRSYCIVDGPSPQAIREAALACGLPVDRISEVRTLERDALPVAPVLPDPTRRQSSEPV